MGNGLRTVDDGGWLVDDGRMGDVGWTADGGEHMNCAAGAVGRPKVARSNTWSIRQLGWYKRWANQAFRATICKTVACNMDP